MILLIKEEISELYTHSLAAEVQVLGKNPRNLLLLTPDILTVPLPNMSLQLQKGEEEESNCAMKLCSLLKESGLQGIES